MKLKINRKNIIVLMAILAMVVYAGGARLMAEDKAVANSEENLCQCPTCVESRTEEHGDHDEHEEDGHDDHEADAHEEDDQCGGCEEDLHAEEADGHDDHEADAHTEGDECDGHEEDAGGISLGLETGNMLKMATSIASGGDLHFNTRLTGQIRLNEDNLAHIVPLTPGIVRKVSKRIGDQVKKGETLAWVESIELGQSKIKYLNAMAELGCCAMNLARSQQIHDNTLKLTEMLKSDPTLDELRKMDGLEMGANRSTLIKVYSEYIFAKAAYEREKSLYDQKISSKEEYLIAQGNFKKSEAEHFAMLDTIEFQVKQDLLETKREQQSQEIAVKGDERTLYVYGQSEDDIKRLNALAMGTTADQTHQEACSDPNCKDCVKPASQITNTSVVNADFSNLGRFPLRAAFDGVIIDKHITLGERISAESTCFTIADLDTVWIDLNIFAKDLSTVKKGQTVLIDSGNSTAQGKIIFVSPVLDSKTRTATARITLDNTKGNFPPGLFVTAILKGKGYPAGIVVNKDAVQTVDGKKCVFVKEGKSYEQRFVVAGRSDAENVEIVSGLKKGEVYISKGAFDLKAKIVTSTLDSHAGHGH